MRTIFFIAALSITGFSTLPQAERNPPQIQKIVPCDTKGENTIRNTKAMCLMSIEPIEVRELSSLN